MQNITLRRIVSGGQTGVDRAALDTALAWQLEVGGWCPRGRCAEDGPLGRCYLLVETPLETPSQRTKWNVRDSDGTLILVCGASSPGTETTMEVVRQLKKPCFCFDVTQYWALVEVQQWLQEHRIAILNVAGPRESEAPGIYREACRVMDALFVQLRCDGDGSQRFPERIYV